VDPFDAPKLIGGTRRPFNLKQRLGAEACEDIVRRYEAGEIAQVLADEYKVSKSGVLVLLRSRVVVMRRLAVSPEQTGRILFCLQSSDDCLITRSMNEANERSLYEHMGEDALGYVLSVDLGSLRERFQDRDQHPLNANQEVVLQQLVLLDEQMQTWQAGSDTAAQWASKLTEISAVPPNLAVGIAARTLSGGAVPVIPSDLSDIEQQLIRLTVENYPGLIVRQSDDPFDRRFSLPARMFQHPANEEFQRLARLDPDLQRLFTEENETSGRVGSVIRSTGQGGGIQLWTLAEMLIQSGWSMACLTHVVPTPEQFIESVRFSLRTMREAINGRPATVPARVGLTGILFPEGVTEMDLGWGRIRKVDARDDVYVRSTTLNGQLTGTNQRGETAIINYSGDLVLEMDVPFAIDLREINIMTEGWPKEMRVSYEAVAMAVENLRLGLLLAFPSERVVLHTSWQTIVDPFTQGRFAGWNGDITRAVGLMPTQLTRSRVTNWKTWATRIGRKRIPTIGVAIRRMLAAVAERRTPEDVLVDSVIVWENLFGARTETTLRVSSSLAWLLGSSSEDRRIKQSRYKKIYDFRSQVVHGDPAVNEIRLQVYATEAVQISIDALSKIFKDRPDLLDVTKSEERSIEIMHAGDVRTS